MTMLPTQYRPALRWVLIAAVALFYTTALAHAANWSDTSVGWRSGDRFREPNNPADIHKDILSFAYTGGYDYGSQFFNLDMLMSNPSDPASITGQTGAVEAYVVYRLTLDFGKIGASDWSMGPIKSVGLTLGADWNTKNDIYYNSRKRMLVLGPTLMWDVPGHLETSLLALYESNAPRSVYPPISSVHERYVYNLHPAIAITWGVPIGALVSFNGFLQVIAPKGHNELGQATGMETHFDAQLMLDIGALAGGNDNIFLIGPEYEYWNNKFGNTAATTGGNGYRASTPMLRLEYHF